MSEAERFRQTGRRRVEYGVTWFEGVDSTNRQPVLIYEFDDEPVSRARDFRSDYVCNVAAVHREGERWRLVASTPPGWKRWSRAHGPLSDVEVLGVARALRDAARSDLVHGNVSASQLVLVHGRAKLAGYGVPWHDREIELTDDLAGFAALLEETGCETEDETVRALLEQCLATEPSDRPTAEELCLALESVFTEATEVIEQVPPPMPAGGTRELQFDEGDEHDDEVREMERVAGRRRLVLLAVLFLSVVALALLALYGPRLTTNGIRAGQEATFYVVEVDVEPDDLPPVTIHLISSPEGSELQRGRVLGTAPRHLALDRPGVWAFQGVLQDRRSEIVEISVPEQRSLTLTLPSAP